MKVRIWLLGIAVLAGCGSIEKADDDDTADDTADDTSDDDTADDDDGAEPGFYRLYVDVSGLAGTLVLQNGDDELTITENGLHRFATDLADGADYEVTVTSDPEVQNCHVAAGAGAIDSADVQLAVGCYGNIFMQVDDNPDDSIYNFELWMSDGTPGGTGRSLSFNDDEAVGSSLSAMVRLGGQLYMGADDGSGYALWRTDGTEAGTAKVRDFSFHGVGSQSLIHDGALYFVANGDTAGTELWRYDGMAAPQRLTDIYASGNTGFGYDFAAVGNRLVFSANEAVLGDNPWVYDIDAGITGLLRDVDPGAFSGQVGNMLTIGDRVVFSARDDDLGSSVFVTDGTPGGTVPIRDMNPNSDGGLIIFLGTDGTNVYFQGNDGSTGNELWKTDGTIAGTTQVRDINLFADDSNPSSMVAFAGEMWFVATDANGAELWHTNGTSGGTQKLEVNPSESIGSNPSTLKVVGDRLYFIADGGDGAGSELWSTDGTPEGTTRITDLVPGPDPGVGGLGPWDGRVLYFFDASYDTTTLWSTDGTAEGTQKVKDLCAAPVCNPYAQFVNIIE